MPRTPKTFNPNAAPPLNPAYFNELELDLAALVNNVRDELVGGIIGQALIKNSSVDLDFSWQSILSQAVADGRYVNETDHTKAAHDALALDHDALTNARQVDPSSTDVNRNKHLSNNDAKGWEDHRVSTSNPHSTTAAQTGALASVDGVSNAGGNVDFVAGTGMTITPDDSANTITFASSGGGGGGASPPFADDLALVQDNIDTTKQLRIDVGNVAPSTTRALTMPNADVNLAADQAAGTPSLRTLGTGAAQAAAGDHAHAHSSLTGIDTDSATTAIHHTLGTGANQAAAGNDSRLSDARTPTDSSVTNAKVASGAAIDESKLNLASDAAAGTASRRTLGTGASQAVAGTHVGSGGTAHADATGSVSGFMSGADKTKSDKYNTNSYFWSAYQSTQQTDIASVTATKLNFDTLVDAAYNGGGNYSTATSLFTAPVDGLYLINGGYLISPAVDAKEVRLYAYINSAANIIMDQKHTNGTGTIGAYGHALVFLAATTTVGLAVYHNFGVATSDITAGSVQTWFHGMILRTL